MSQALQDLLPPGHPARGCYGCGADNHDGLRLKSYRDPSGILLCRFEPRPTQTAFPGMTNGGILATLMDCHGVWTAMAARFDDEAIARIGMDDGIFVTRALSVEFLNPSPINALLSAQGRLVEEGRRSLTTEVEVFAGDTLCARGRVVTVRVRKG